MAITRVSNGWILELPKMDPQHAAFASMMPKIADAIRGRDPGDIETIMAENGITGMPTIPTDTEIYVFHSFRELMSFIDLNSDIANGE